MATQESSVEFAGGTLGRQRHICAFFNSIDEEHRVLRSFIKDGMTRGERAFHIVDPGLRDQHLKRLAELGINVEQALEAGQLEVRPWQEAYLLGDHFDQDAMLALIEEVLQSGASSGYPLTRLLGHMEWALLDKPGVDNLGEYETRRNYVLPKYDDPVICTYDLSKFPSSVAMDIMRTHPVVIIGGVLQENPFFVSPDNFLHPGGLGRQGTRSDLRRARGCAGRFFGPRFCFCAFVRSQRGYRGRSDAGKHLERISRLAGISRPPGFPQGNHSRRGRPGHLPRSRDSDRRRW